MDFSNQLIEWYLQNKRDLPWRNTTNPYKIWLSEIILQQTRVTQGLPYYIKFINSFPTVYDLANASEETVLKHWEGLGYYSRARNLHHTAKHITTELQGNFPNNYLNLLQLKGVGEYTAAAIASFAYNENVAVVDGNVFRVLARYFGLQDDISLPKTKKEFQKLANQLLPKGNASNFNQALMEFGALQCVPQNPNCGDCIFNTKCFALQKKKVNELPFKSKKTKIRKRHFHYIIIRDAANQFLIEQRTQNDIWKNLYQFPLIETETKTSFTKISKQIHSQYNTDKVVYLENLEITHKLSHQHLHIRFYEIKKDIKIDNFIPFNEVISKPFPIVLHNFIKTNYFELDKK